ncbi:alpha-N-acetylgalactosaminide alpha-2,6-sialyltransferase 3-like isoform X3 [Denticeps clupeoides]|uniref:alpha-N-acetylneuraminyl-2,3-beta-galactosyl-1,3-N-acetylgalactosaminide6-alpha-sialyltransferase n=1 Tax=Denticeps clupeoides TaxID=299321 RepID=A0A8C4CQS6_9TELE|nr:alpha-N-acetylgalactosaminide alpha-2,6-sialyltransferase 3-like isoform X3 [Denticeps clupeoides]XP_028833891.1 alpha-N-acetylgalactosaminide alpha-2,6-sialyltransferase 3-like isoform X3 [Denticeps clupeoides]
MAWIWKKKSVIATSLIALLSLFVLVVNYSEKPYFLLQPMLGHSLSSPWMLFRQNHKVYKPHVGYISIPKQEPLKLHCDVCSVVSSSGQMLGQGAGLDIDHSSCIWRMNSAPTRGFERDVGRRTTLRMVSHTSVPLLLQRPQHFFGQANDTVYVVWGPLRNMRQDGKGIVYNMLRQAAENFPQARIFVTTEERMNYCDKVFKKETGKDRIQSGSYLSTGWFTLILAMDMCKEIHVYGMINDTYCKTEGYRKVPYHYYEAGSRDECAEYLLHESAPYGGHRFITEKAVFAKWAKTHNIKFFNPEWQLS